MTEMDSPAREDELVSPGRLLGRLRVDRGMSLADVAQRLKYAPRQIEALEADDFTRLPDLTFVRGMIRSYARLLGTDPGLLVAELDKVHSPTSLTVSLPATAIPFPDGKRKATRMYALLSLFAVFIAVAVAFDFRPLQYFQTPVSDSGGGVTTSENRTEPKQGIPVGGAPAAMPSQPTSNSFKDSLIETTTIGPPTAALAEASIEARPKHSVGRKIIVLQFEKDAWVEIRQSDGKLLLSQLNPAGTRQIVEGSPPFALIIGNAPSVRVHYNDQPVDLRPHFKVDVARFTLD